MRETRTPPWLCERCGYMMDAVSPIEKARAVPAPGDITLCLNCGAAYTLGEGFVWHPCTAADEAAWPSRVKHQVMRARVARHLAVPDLTKRDRHA